MDLKFPYRKSKRASEYCIYCSNNSKKNPECSFFRFPKDENRCNRWKANSQMALLDSFTSEQCHKTFRVCSIHFEKSMFSSLQMNRLKRDAVPTIFDGVNSLEILTTHEPIGSSKFHPIPSADDDVKGVVTKTSYQLDPIPSTSFAEDNFEETVMETSYQLDPIPSTSYAKDNLEEASTQTPPSLSKYSPRKCHLRNKIRALQRKQMVQTHHPSSRIKIEEVVEFVKENCSPALATFLKAQLTLSKKLPKGSRYSNEYKQFALTIYFLGPKVYKYISKCFRLPSKSTLFRITQNWNLSNGFNNFLFSALEMRVKLLPDNNKYCILCIDEMSIKSSLFYNISRDEIIGFHDVGEKTYEPASEALVLMARGINENWKQPLAYFLVNSSCPARDLETIIIEAIRRLKTIGLTVMSLISDHGSNFYKLIKQLNVTPEHPFFYVDNLKVFYMIDVPHLIKSTRNNFFKYHFEIKEGVTSKKYLEEFYAADKKSKFRLAPKLTDDHLFPNNFKKMKVKLATQVFSATVAAGLNIYVSFGNISGQAVHTINFIENMDKLFDVLNSSRFTRVKYFNRPFMGSKKQIDFLIEMNSLFMNMKVSDFRKKDITNRMKFLKGWQITISAFLGMWPILKKVGLNKVFTRRFNQDCLEKFFGKIRQQSGNCRNPTPIQFQRSFKKLFALGYFEQTEGTNCLTRY